VDLVEVDVIGLEAAEAGVDGVHDVAAGGADVVAAGAGAAEGLGGDDDLSAGDVQVFEGLTEGLFAFALGVDIGGIEEVDADVDGGLDELVGSGLVDGADGAEEASAAVEGHGAKTERGDEEAGVAEGLILHGIPLCRGVRRWKFDVLERWRDSRETKEGEGDRAGQAAGTPSFVRLGFLLR
jgi:hypothetical protein